MATAEKREPAAASGEWVSLPDAARLLGRHRQQVLTLIVRGNLTAETRGRWTFISRASIDAYLAATANT